MGAADRALSDARRDLASRSQPKAQCTSLKSNMGHLEAAAAAAGLSSLALTQLSAAEVAVNAQMRGYGVGGLLNVVDSSSVHRRCISQNPPQAPVSRAVA